MISAKSDGKEYELAFDDYLCERKVARIRVDDTRRSPQADEPVKSPDFLVRSPANSWLLVDIKGRRLTRRRPALQNWVTADDITGLDLWKRTFGEQAEALLVFMYHLSWDLKRVAFSDMVRVADRYYGVLAVRLDEYRERMRVRSPKWQTVHLAAADFRELAKPLSCWL